MLRMTSLALLAGAAFAGTGAGAGRWQGADDLPTNPLACDGAPGDGRRQGL